MTVGCCSRWQHLAGAAVGAILELETAAMVHQPATHLQMAGLRGGMQRSATELRLRVGIRAE